MPVLDAHAHCWLTLPMDNLQPRWREANIDGGVLYSHVEEINDRYASDFVDGEFYRRSSEQVHSYLESLISEHIFAYWFVWNDFSPPGKLFSGIKWHRHSNEPCYQYDTDACRKIIEHICNLRLPVVVEEEFHNTLTLVKIINKRTVVIIPHLGWLNGGYECLKEAGLYENPAVFVDTALASPADIKDFASNYGVQRILFGSDFPFGEPLYERAKIEKIFTAKEREKVLGQNLLELLGK